MTLIISGSMLFTKNILHPKAVSSGPTILSPFAVNTLFPTSSGSSVIITLPK